jgi:streptogramin lyase
VDSPFPIAVRIGTRSVWTLNANTESVTRIDRRLDGIAATAEIGQGRAPAQIAPGAGNTLWVADSDGTVARIEGGTVHTFQLPQPVVAVATTRDGLWAALSPGL